MSTGVLVAAVVAVPLVLRAGGSIAIDGLQQNALIGASRLTDFAVRIVPHGVSTHSLNASLDGHDLAVTHTGSDYVVRPSGLHDGRHQLVVSASGGHLFGKTRAKRSFVVDTTAPRLSLTVPAQAVSIAAPVQVTGTVEPGASVTAPGGQVTLTGTSLRITTPTRRSVRGSSPRTPPATAPFARSPCRRATPTRSAAYT